ncbi:hypothetical protein CsSME_00039212 [Camellia sinensis var. sinensis]
MEEHTINIEETKALVDEAACIFRVHEGMRNVNEKAYTPILISIGPYHRGQPNYLLWKNVKSIIWNCSFNVTTICVRRIM